MEALMKKILLLVVLLALGAVVARKAMANA
jgi:hypothetical protein